MSEQAPHPVDEHGFLVQGREDMPAERYGWTRPGNKDWRLYKFRPQWVNPGGTIMGAHVGFAGGPRWEWRKHSEESLDSLHALMSRLGLDPAGGLGQLKAHHYDYVDGREVTPEEIAIARDDMTARPPAERDNAGQDLGVLPEDFYALSRRKERIKGGLGRGKRITDFARFALLAGVRVEMEHTTDPRIAAEIAMDHLTEDPEYYAKLKKAKLARMQAPAGGQITGGGTQTGGLYQRGGQFAGRARRRIRDVIMAWLTRGENAPARLAAPKKKKKTSAADKGDLTVEDLRTEKPAAELEPEEKKRVGPLPALDTAIHAAKGETAGPEKIRSRLTIRELKDVEDQLRLPPHLHLSKSKLNKDKTDAEEVGRLTLDDYYYWANKVARHITSTGLTETTRKRIQNPAHLSKAKLAFIVGRMAREVEQAKSAFADSGGAQKWYGDHVAAMTRHLYDEFHRGQPEDDELWGKLDKKTGRVHGGAAITLAKLLVAATSGGMKPHENYDTAHAMIEGGKKYGTGSENPFKSIPDNQIDDFNEWVNRVEAWHAARKTGVTREDILHPGVDLRDRVKWFEKVMQPLRADEEGKALNAGGGTNSKARYSGIIARYVGQKGAEGVRGEPVAVQKQTEWRSPYISTVGKPEHITLNPSDLAHLGDAPTGEVDYTKKLYDLNGGSGQIETQKLPAVEADGRLQPPGWTARNDQVLDNRDKINGVVAYFTDKAGGDEREGMKRAAEFFLTEQSPQTFRDIIEHTAGIAGGKGAPKLEELSSGRFKKAGTEKKSVRYARFVSRVVEWGKKNGRTITPQQVLLATRLYDSEKENKGFYFSGQPLPGAFLLGPKFGAFSLNLHLDQPGSEHLGQHLTADLWWSRDWNTMLGTLFGPSGKKSGRQETPRGGPERKLMRKAAQLAAERAGLDNVAQLQAVLWYYEQQKPQWFGVDTSSTSYLDGANEVAGRKEKGEKRYCIHPTSGNITVIHASKKCPR